MAGAAIAVAVTAVVAGAAVSIKGQLDAAESAKKLARAKAEQAQNQDKASKVARKAEAKLQARKFRLEAGANEAAAAFSGAEKFGDLFRADVTTFEAEQLILDFNRDVFGVNLQNQGNVAIFEGDAFAAAQVTGAIGTGISAVGTIASFGIAGGASPGPSGSTGTALGGQTVSAGGTSVQGIGSSLRTSGKFF